MSSKVSFPGSRRAENCNQWPNPFTCIVMTFILHEGKVNKKKVIPEEITLFLYVNQSVEDDLECHAKTELHMPAAEDVALAWAIAKE